MNLVNITAIKPFDDPLDGCKYVVFVQDCPYLDEEEAFQHLTKVIKYAKYFKVYVIPFRFLKENKITMCMISPQGKILGTQEAIHLSLNYRNTFLRGDKVNIIKTEDAAFYLSVDVDIFRPEVMRTAMDNGAEIIISSRYMDMINDTPHRACCGAENAAISNGIYVADITEEGGRFIDPWNIKGCIRDTKTLGEINTIWSCNMDILHKSREENYLELNTKLYEKYIDYLVR